MSVRVHEGMGKVDWLQQASDFLHEAAVFAITGAPIFVMTPPFFKAAS